MPYRKIFGNAVSGLALMVLVLAGCHRNPPPKVPEVVPTSPPPAPAPVSQATPIPDEYARIKAMDPEAINRLGLFADVHFDFDKADILPADQNVLTRNADVLKKFDFLKVAVEGHCDERGSVKYNLALGERRARAAYDYLVSLGVPAERLTNTSYGKEAPLCMEHNEDCWAKNRRGHFSVTGKAARR